MNSTPTDWKRIEELAEKATPRPWTSVASNQPGRAFLCKSPRELVFATGTSLSVGGHAKEADADYCEAACNAAPDMAARLRRLEEILGEKLRRYISEIVTVSLGRNRRDADQDRGQRVVGLPDGRVTRPRFARLARESFAGSERSLVGR
jgi:hypothetical protein